jgi:hypothetical protein
MRFSTSGFLMNQFPQAPEKGPVIYGFAISGSIKINLRSKSQNCKLQKILGPQITIHKLPQMQKVRKKFCKSKG